MVSAGILVVNLLKIVFVIVGAHLAITKVLPMLKDTLSGFDRKVANGLISLFAVLIIVFAGLAIFEFIEATGSKALSYLLVIKPAFDIVFSLEYYLKYVILGVIVILGLKAFKRA